MKRKCEECPADVQAVCRHAFGEFWGEKSRSGEGCDNPLDAVAKAWYAAGWTPEAKARGDMVIIDDRPERPTASKTQLKMPTRPRRPTASKIQSGVPTGPRVSAAIARQADLFFGKKN